MCKCEEFEGHIKIDEMCSELLIYHEKTKNLIYFTINFCPFCGENLNKEKSKPISPS
jgi:hypothetical protein